MVILALSSWTRCLGPPVSWSTANTAARGILELVRQLSHSSFQSLLTASHFTQKKSQILPTAYKVLSELHILPPKCLQPHILVLPASSPSTLTSLNRPDMLPSPGLCTCYSSVWSTVSKVPKPRLNLCLNVTSALRLSPATRCRAEPNPPHSHPPSLLGLVSHIRKFLQHNHDRLSCQAGKFP